jgi:small subunit ribosomal protein S6
METQYELIVLFPTKMNDIMAEKTLADLAKASKFKVVEVDKWGIKQLAYPIKKETKAYFLRLVIEGGDTKTLANALKLDESLLRHLLVKYNGKIEAKKAVKVRKETK